MSDEYDVYSEFQNTITDKLDDMNLTLTAIRRDLPHLKFDFWEFFWFFLVIMFFVNWEGSKLDRWTDRVWYSFYYNARWIDVDINKRPFDCDFLRAPVGTKGCNYKKNTFIFNNEERNKELQQATTVEERKQISNRPNSIVLYWQKREN
jgi:hypothetical protein